MFTNFINFFSSNEAMIFSFFLTLVYFTVSLIVMGWGVRKIVDKLTALYEEKRNNSTTDENS